MTTQIAQAWGIILSATGGLILALSHGTVLVIREVRRRADGIPPVPPLRPAAPAVTPPKGTP